MIISMSQFTNAVNYVDVQIAASLSLACAFVSSVLSLILIFYFGAYDEHTNRARHWNTQASNYLSISP
jgi:hypothetical protein